MKSDRAIQRTERERKITFHNITGKPLGTGGCTIRTETIFKDRAKLQSDYVPERLVNREEEFRELVDLFVPVLKDGASQRVLIHGEAGTGKTALARRFSKEFERVSKKKGVRMDLTYVDCRAERTEFDVTRKMAECLELDPPGSGVSSKRLLNEIAEFLEREDSRLVAVLDWLDFLVRREGDDLIYSLTRMWENSDEPNRISLVGISREPDVTKLLDMWTRSTLLHNRVELDRYSGSELRDILEERVGLAFKSGAVREEAIDLISKDAPWQDGAGFALEWLRKAGRTAEKEESSRVSPRHALEAKSKVHVRAPEGSLRKLDEHELLILLALAKELKESSQKHVSTGELEGRYRKICGEFDVEGKEHVTFWKRVKRLSAFGIVEAKKKDIEFGGQTQDIRVPGNSAEVLDSALEHFLEKRTGR